MSLADKEWERIQERAFTKWVNSHIRKRGQVVEDLTKDFQDGVKLIQLYEAISDESLGKYYAQPKMKFHNIANLNSVVDKINSFVSSVGIKVQFSAEQVFEGDKRQILGLIWCLIHKFEIQDISEEELSAKEGLLLWCKKKTDGYSHVKVENFHYSFQDGLAFLALIHRHRPDLVGDWSQFDPANKKENLQRAFEIAERDLDIPQLLDINDMTEYKPDEKSVMTYVAYYWKKFAQGQKAEKAGKIIGRSAARLRELQQMTSDYEQRATALLQWIESAQQQHSDTSAEHFGNDLAQVSEKSVAFKDFKNTQKPQQLAEKLDVEVLLANLRTQQKNAGLPVYTPPENLSTESINAAWAGLNDAQEQYERALNERIALMKRLEALLGRFRSRANKIQQWQEGKLGAFAGEDVAKYTDVASLQARLKTLETFSDESATVQRSLDQSKQIAQEISGNAHAASEEVNSTEQQLAERQQQVADAAQQLQSSLQSALDSLEAALQKCLDYSRQAEQFNLTLEDAGLALSEQVVASNVSDVEVYSNILKKIGQDLESSAGTLQTLEQLSQEIIEVGRDPLTYSSHTLESLQSKYQATKESYEQRSQEVAVEQTKQEGNAGLLEQFTAATTEYGTWTEEQKNAVNGIVEGELNQQLEQLYAKQTELSGETDSKLESLREQYKQLEQADITEQSPVSMQALHVLNEQLKSLIRKRIESVEQQLLANSASNVSEEQLEEFKKTFDFFDKEKDGKLNLLEFKACISALGQDLPDDEVKKVFTSLDKDASGFIDFPEFIEYMSAITKEGSGYSDVLEAFKTLAGGADFVTETQLRGSGMSTEEIEYLLANMPKTDNGFDYKTYLAGQYGSA